MAPPNWNTGEQIRDHKLAASIINGHGNEEYAVFDDANLVKLKEFVEDPSSAGEMMKVYGWQDPEHGAANGDLVGFLVARHGTKDAAFDDRDLEMLRGWFERGMPIGEKSVR